MERVDFSFLSEIFTNPFLGIITLSSVGFSPAFNP